METRPGLSKHTLLTFANGVIFILVIAMNYLANSLPINGLMTGEISDFYPNLFVPAGRTFAIWGVIYLLMAGFVIFPLVRPAQRAKIGVFGWLFVLSGLLNVGWLLAWHYRLMGLDLVFMLSLLAILIKMYFIKKSTSPTGWMDKWFIHTFISVYLGWICVATIANSTALLVHIQWAGWGVSTETWTWFLMSIAAGLAMWFLWTYGNVALLIVIAWALYGIYTKQSSDGGVKSIAHYALALTVILLVAGVISTVRPWIKPNKTSLGPKVRS